MSEMLGVLITWILITVIGFIAATFLHDLFTGGWWE